MKIISPHKGFQERFVRSNIDVVFGGGVLNAGKPNPLNTKILTASGWSTMGEMRVGSRILTPWNGETTVTAVYPQGVQDCYRIETSDGRVCEAGLEHLWMIRTRKQYEKYHNHKDMHRNFMIMTTKELIEGLKNNQRYFIPLPKAQEFPEKELPIPPYVLGVMIGDGCLKETGCVNRFIISNSENDIIEKVRRLTDSTYVRECANNYSKVFHSPNARKYMEYLSNVGLRDYSYNKFIPHEYLFGSIEQRRQLLYGLMDTDGSVGVSDEFSFSTTSKRLADDFMHLCRSLGYIVEIHKDNRYWKYTNGEAYEISIKTDDVIFTSQKHLKRHYKFNKTRQYKKTKDHVRIKSIEYVGKKQLQCIKVDDKDHLYIIDDFITTHNSFGAILSLAEPSLDPNFRACFTRRTFSELKSGGGVVDDVETCYKDYASVKRTDPPRATFPSGAFVDFRQINDENPAKVKEIWKGSQYDLIYMDELTSYEFSTFKYLMTRNRGKAKWTGKFRGTTNPERDCWVRKFIDWYVGTDGLIIPERDGMIRYFYLGDGEDVEDVTWGDSKLEVYEKSKIDIDAKLRILGEGFTYENLIKSFTFYLGHMSENISSIGGNKDYAGSVAAVGGKQAKQLIEGNWNVSLKNDEQMPIPIHLAESVFANDPRINNDKWITADLADTGVDNTVILVWNGLHIHDYLILCTSTPRMNAEKLMVMAEKHNIPDNHIVYDGIRAVYINDYIPEAIPFVSYRKTRGKYGRAYYNLKDECYARLVNVIRRGNLSMDDKIASAVYDHLNMSVPITIRNEFIEECSVVKFKDMPGGKKTLLNKKEMNAILGKGRSMDLLDPIAMRMYPLLEYEYGQELVMTECNSESKNESRYDTVDVYNENIWC